MSLNMIVIPKIKYKSTTSVLYSLYLSLGYFIEAGSTLYGSNLADTKPELQIIFPHFKIYDAKIFENIADAYVRIYMTSESERGAYK